LRPPKELAPEMLSAFRRRDARRLRKLNDQMMASASMELDSVTLNLAIYSYVLSKIASKPRYLSPEHASLLKNVERDLDRLVGRIRGADQREAETLFHALDRSIRNLEKRDSRFLTDLMSKGRLKMAATLYAQGMSLGTASERTGVEKQEILDYAGSSMMFDRLSEEIGILERMKKARGFLGVG